MEPSPRPHRWQEFVGERHQREVVRRRVPGSHAEKSVRVTAGVAACPQTRRFEALMPPWTTPRACAAPRRAPTFASSFTRSLTEACVRSQ